MINLLQHTQVDESKYLSDIDLLFAAPSIFASDHSYCRDEKHYAMFNTANVIAKLRNEGYYPVTARSNGSSKDCNVDTRKHMVRLAHYNFINSPLKVNDERPELVITNSHDGSSSFHIMGGLWRKVCSNGLMVMQNGVEDIKVRHIGHTFDEVIAASLKVADSMSDIMETVNTMKGINLTSKQQRDLAAEIAEIRFEKDKIKTPEALLTLRRYEDSWQPSLYNTFNVIQENMIRGGQRVTDREMRPIRNIDTDIQLNKQMWGIVYNRMNDLMVA